MATVRNAAGIAVSTASVEIDFATAPAALTQTEMRQRDELAQQRRIGPTDVQP